MAEERMTVDGKQVTIRPMDDSYIIDACAHDRAKGLSYPTFRRFHEELMKRYGNSAILAWCGPEVVGFVNFYPDNFDSPAALCPGVESKLNEKFAETEWPTQPSDTLAISCVNISEGFRRKQVGSALVKHVIAWAKENGYRRITAGANDTQWWVPCKPFWEKLGFRVYRTEEFEKPREDGEKRVYSMELILSGE